MSSMRSILYSWSASLKYARALSLDQSSRVISSPDLEQLVHLLLDALQVLGRERRLNFEVVVETVLDGRSDGELRSRKQLLDGMGHHVRRRVPQHEQALFVLVTQEPQFSLPCDALVAVAKLSIEEYGDGIATPCVSKRRHHLGHRYFIAFEAFLRPVWKCYANHGPAAPRFRSRLR